MDVRRLRTGEWLLALAGVAAAISPFLPWYEGFGGYEITGWKALSRVDVLLFVDGLLAIGVVVLTAQQRTAAAPIAAQALYTLFAAAVCVAVAIRFLGWPDQLSRDVGAWVAIVSAPLLVAAAMLAMRDERLSRPGRQTDATGVPVDSSTEVETVSPPRP